MSYAGAGTAPGTAGELVQGLTSAGKYFHITAPINLCSKITVSIVPSTQWFYTGLVRSLPRVRAAIEATAAHIGAGPFAVSIDRTTRLPEARGMGSSTADILAAIRATANALSHPLTPAEEAMIATLVGPSGGTMHPGLTAFVQGTGEVLRQYAWSPRMDVILTVPSRRLNTADVDLSAYSEHTAEFDGLLETLTWASNARDEEAFMFAATTSADLNQAVNPNPLHKQLTNLITDLGGDGLIVAHTGTVAGILFLHSDIEALTSAAAVVAEEMPADVGVQLVNIAGS